MKYFLLCSALFFVLAHNFLTAMHEEINDIIKNGDQEVHSDHENKEKNVNIQIADFVHNLLHIKTNAFEESADGKTIMERALEHLKLKHPKKYNKIKNSYFQIKDFYFQNFTKSKHKNKDFSSAESKIIQLCFLMLEEQNNEDRKNYNQERLRKWLSFGWGIITTAATIGVSLYAALNPVKIICNGTIA